MARVKGANSDYLFKVDEGQIVADETADPLFLELFICPYNQPSRVDERDDEKVFCTGLDAACPAEGDSPGHARILLHQEHGIELRAGAGALQIGHGGALTVTHSATAKTTLRPEAGGLTLDGGTGGLSVAGPLAARDRLRLRLEGGAEARVELAAAGLTISFGGASVRLTSEGAVELTPKTGQPLKLGAQSFTAQELLKLKTLLSQQ